MIKWYNKQRHRRCSSCGRAFSIPFWKWCIRLFIDAEWGYCKCPHCRNSGWHRCVDPTQSGWVNCHECDYKYECETYDYRTGCYMGKVEKQ